MAQVFYLNKSTRAYMASARAHLYSCFRMVRMGRDKAALRYANRAVAAYDKAIEASLEKGHSFPRSQSAKVSAA